LTPTRAEELVQQVAVGRVHFDAVETGTQGVGRTLCVGGDHAGDFIERQGAGLGGGFAMVAAIGFLHVAVGLGLDGGRGDGIDAARLQQRVGDAPHVPELQDDATALVVHRPGDLLPALDLLGAVDAGSPGVALAFGADLGGLADDQAGAGTLGVIGGVEFAGDVAGLQAALAGEGGHHHRVGKLEATQLGGLEQVACGHRCDLHRLHSA